MQSLFKSIINIIVFYSCRKIEHKKYNSQTVNFDFALLQMRNGFDLPNIPNVSPACLPSANKSPANVEASAHGDDEFITNNEFIMNNFGKVKVPKTIIYHFQVLISGWGNTRTDGSSFPNMLQKVKEMERSQYFPYIFKCNCIRPPFIQCRRSNARRPTREIGPSLAFVQAKLARTPVR